MTGFETHLKTGVVLLVNMRVDFLCVTNYDFPALEMPQTLRDFHESYEGICFQFLVLFVGNTSFVNKLIQYTQCLTQD